jgi:L-histidine Nalpha-methyltransferase
MEATARRIRAVLIYHRKACREVRGELVLGRSFSFRTGETIHTENSYKYSLDRFTALARGSGWTPRAAWTDADKLFSVHELVASE